MATSTSSPRAAPCRPPSSSPTRARNNRCGCAARPGRARLRSRQRWLHGPRGLDARLRDRRSHRRRAPGDHRRTHPRRDLGAPGHDPCAAPDDARADPNDDRARCRRGVRAARLWRGRAHAPRHRRWRLRRGGSRRGRLRLPAAVPRVGRPAHRLGALAERLRAGHRGDERRAHRAGRGRLARGRGRHARRRSARPPR